MFPDITKCQFGYVEGFYKLSIFKH